LAIADQLALIARFDLKADGPRLHRQYRRDGRHAQADRGCRKVAHVEVDAKALIALRQQMLDGGQRGRLDDIDHHGRGEHGDAPRADAGRRVLGADNQFRRAGEPRADSRKIDHDACS
jgi:hypothetical protein